MVQPCQKASRSFLVMCFSQIFSSLLIYTTWQCSCGNPRHKNSSVLQYWSSCSINSSHMYPKYAHTHSHTHSLNPAAHAACHSFRRTNINNSTQRPVCWPAACVRICHLDGRQAQHQLPLSGSSEINRHDSCYVTLSV